MNARRRWGFALIAVLLAIGVTTTPVSAEADRHALLIGINDYLINDLPHDDQSGPQFPDLNGALNDLKLIEEVLRERFEFEQITTLRDAQATRAAILAALDDLTARVRPGDVVYVHFSGHGSQVPDSGGEEEDGSDETILPHDARTPGVKDITDDELGAAFARLKDARLTVVLDSCHSGTATRGAQLQARWAAPDTRLWLYEEDPVAAKTRAAVEADLHYVLMTGADEQEAALDGPIGGRYYGFFSYLFAQALQDLPRDATAQQIHESVLSGYRAFGRRFRNVPMPEPQLEARGERMQEPVLIHAAVASGSPEPVAAPAKSIAASAEPVAVPAESRSGIAVRLGAMPDALRLEILRGLARFDDVNIATENAPADFVVTHAGGRLVVRSGSDDRPLSSITAKRTRAAARHALRVIKHGRTLARLQRLENRNSALGFSITLLSPIETRDARKTYRVRAENAARDATNSLQLEFQSDTPGYLTVVDVDTEGKISVLFPNPLSEQAGFLPEGFVPAGDAIRIPDALTDPNNAGFVWDIVPPAGVDTLQVFFSTDLEIANEIRQFMAGMAADDVDEAAVRGLVQSLKQRGVKIAATKTLNGKTEATPPTTNVTDAPTIADWTSQTISFLVEGDTP